MFHGADGVRDLCPEDVDDGDRPDESAAVVGGHELAEGEGLQLRGRGVLEQGQDAGCGKEEARVDLGDKLRDILLTC